MTQQSSQKKLNKASKLTGKKNKLMNSDHALNTVISANKSSEQLLSDRIGQLKIDNTKEGQQKLAQLQKEEDEHRAMQAQLAEPFSAQTQGSKKSLKVRKSPSKTN